MIMIQFPKSELVVYTFRIPRNWSSCDHCVQTRTMSVFLSLTHHDLSEQPHNLLPFNNVREELFSMQDDVRVAAVAK